MTVSKLICWPDDLRYLKDILSEDKVSDIKRYHGIKLQNKSKLCEKLSKSKLLIEVLSR